RRLRRRWRPALLRSDFPTNPTRPRGRPARTRRVGRAGLETAAKKSFQNLVGQAGKPDLRGFETAFKLVSGVVRRCGPVGGPDHNAIITGQSQKSIQGGEMPLRMRVHDREPIGAALRRFKKLLERSGLTKELRKRKYYEKPCEGRRRAAMRKM